MPSGTLSALAIGIPTNVIDNPWFDRMTPVSGWEYLILVATAGLTATWFALPAVQSLKGGVRVWGAGLLSTLAVGCPVCNKIVVALLGTSGALAVWAPLQPLLGVASVVLALLAVIAKAKLSRMPCPVPAADTGMASHQMPSSGR